MVMQYEEKPWLLQKMQIQVVAAALEKAEAEDLVEVCKEVGSGYHVRMYFNDRQRLWMDIMEQ